MFQSTPICILTAGTTLNGLNVSQKIIDDIAESYDPNVYNARINEEHYDFAPKLGSVLSVEKQGNQLFAILKPNSLFLRTIERGQLLHTSCEYLEDFNHTGKAYLTGLALTDNPASLGTTEIHLSSKSKQTVHSSTGETISLAQFEESSPDDKDDRKFFARIKKFMSANTQNDPPQQSENNLMNEELKAQFSAQAEKITALSLVVADMASAFKKLSATATEKEPHVEDKSTEKPEKDGDKAPALSTQVEALNAKIDALVVKLSNTSDEAQRNLAGADAEAEAYY